MLVLGLVSLANASMVTFKANGDAGTVDVEAGDTVTITVVADTSAAAGYTLSITETKVSTADYATATELGVVNTGFSVSRNNGTLRNTMTTATSGTNRYMVIDKLSGVTDAAHTVSAGSVLYTFSLLIPALAAVDDTFTLTAAVGSPSFGAGYTHNIDSVAVGTTNAVTLNVVPEPMTIALLGLGGLFLFRRKT